MNTQIRKSHTYFHKIYFWTATIHNWLPLLQANENKELILSSLKKLSDVKLISLYAFVIMPNHIHLIWSQHGMNGKETPKESFEKYTGHMFLRQLNRNKESLQEYATEQSDRNYIFWQRDPLAILIRNRKMAAEKIDYMHYNPLQPHWQLCKDPVEYRYSSAKFYETGEDEFKMLTHYMEKV